MGVRCIQFTMVEDADPRRCPCLVDRTCRDHHAPLVHTAATLARRPHMARRPNHRYLDETAMHTIATSTTGCLRPPARPPKCPRQSEPSDPRLFLPSHGATGRLLATGLLRGGGLRLGRWLAGLARLVSYGKKGSIVVVLGRSDYFGPPTPNNHPCGPGRISSMYLVPYESWAIEGRAKHLTCRHRGVQDLF